MASSAILRSAARALRLRQPLEQRRPLLACRLLSSSVPNERSTNLPSSTRSSNSMEQKKHVNEEEDMKQSILRKMDLISDAIDRQERLLKELEAEIKEDQNSQLHSSLHPKVVSSVSPSVAAIGVSADKEEPHAFLAPGRRQQPDRERFSSGSDMAPAVSITHSRLLKL
ncbi:hypothetical protein U9M48_001066 [Paspalum notatum var. saurae]|uniref:Uncharacterized protein n=1 Tax=Paspalum notatum var. saurae TaxID=547442 RepID=A0AAQ3PEH9_PASNO